jgi:hypothetical protein
LLAIAVEQKNQEKSKKSFFLSLIYFENSMKKRGIVVGL